MNGLKNCAHVACMFKQVARTWSYMCELCHISPTRFEISCAKYASSTNTVVPLLRSLSYELYAGCAHGQSSCAHAVHMMRHVARTCARCSNGVMMRECS